MMSAAAVVLALAVLIPSVRTSCPHVPAGLERNWRFVGIRDGMRIYDVNAPGKAVVSAILSEFNSVYYYARATNVEDLNLSLPDIPSSPDVVYMVTVPTRCGPETFAVVSSTWSRIYVGVVPLSDRIEPIEVNALYCEDLVDMFGCATTVSELKTEDMNRTIHYCYISTSRDENTVAEHLLENGRFIGTIGDVRIYQLDDNTMVNLVPGEPLGIIAYREENA